MQHTATHCHCGADRKGSDHCPECGCEEHETVCDHRSKTDLLWEQGNLYKGYPYGVRVEKQFGSSEVHGPFSSENEAWNYGMELAMASDGTESFALVKIETPQVKQIASTEDVRAYREKKLSPGDRVTIEDPRGGGVHTGTVQAPRKPGLISVQLISVQWDSGVLELVPRDELTKI